MEITSHSAPLVEQRGQIGKDRRETSFARRARLGCGLLLVNPRSRLEEEYVGPGQLVLSRREACQMSGLTGLPSRT